MPGIGCLRLALAATTMSISSGSSPLAAIALPPAATAIPTSVSSSRRLRTRPSGVPAGRRVPSATSAGRIVPRVGATTIRQPKTLPASATAVRQQFAGAVEIGRAGDGEDVDVGPLPLALGQAGQG